MPDEEMRFEITGDVAQKLLRGIDELDKSMGQLTRRMDKLDDATTGGGKATATAVLQWQALGHALDQVGRQSEALGRSMTASGERILRSMGRIGQAATAQFAEFDQAVQNSVTVTGLAGDAFDAATGQLSNFALEVSRMSAKSPTEIANAFYALGSAGFTVEQQMEATTGVIALAEATMSEVPFAAELATSSMKAFGLETADMGAIVNTMAAGISSSRLTMERLGYSLPYVATAARGFGLTLEQTVATLGKMVDQGLEASMAGTGLRQVFTHLSNVTAPMEQVLTKYGLTAGDVSLSTHTLFEALQTLNEAMANVAPAERQSDIMQAFGARAGTAASILINTGAPALEAFTEKITGTNRALEMQAQQLDTLGGRWTILGSTWSEVGTRLTEGASEPLKEFVEFLQETMEGLLDSGDVAAIGRGLAEGVQQVLGPLRELVLHLEAGVKWFAQLPPGVQGLTVSLSALAGIALTAGGTVLMLTGRLAGMLAPLAFLKAAGGLPAVIGPLQTILRFAPLLATRLGYVGLALGALKVGVDKNIFGLGNLVESIKNTTRVAAKMDDGHQAVAKALTDAGTAAVLAQDQAVVLTDKYESLEKEAGRLWDALDSIVDRLLDWTTAAPEGVTWTGLLELGVESLEWAVGRLADGFLVLDEALGAIVDTLTLVVGYAKDAAVGLWGVVTGNDALVDSVRTWDERTEGLFTGFRAPQELTPGAWPGGGFLGAGGLTLDEFQAQLREGERWRAQVAAGMPAAAAAQEAATAGVRGTGRGGGGGGGPAEQTARQIADEVARSIKETLDAVRDKQLAEQGMEAAMRERDMQALANEQALALIGAAPEVGRIIAENYLENIQRALGGFPVGLGDLFGAGIGPLSERDIRQLQMFGPSIAGQGFAQPLPGVEQFPSSPFMNQRMLQRLLDNITAQAERQAERNRMGLERQRAAAGAMLTGEVVVDARQERMMRRLSDAMLDAAIGAESFGAAVQDMMGAIARTFMERFMERLLEGLLGKLLRKLDGLMDSIAKRAGWGGGVGVIGGTLLGGGGQGASIGASLGTAAGSLLGPWGAVGGGLIGGLIGGGKDRNPQIDRTNDLLQEINNSLRPQADWFRTVSSETLFGPSERYYGGRSGTNFGEEYVTTAARGALVR